MPARRPLGVASLALLALSACADDRGVGGELGEWSAPLSAACPPTPDPFAGPVQGIDISQYQTVSSWAKVAASERFVIIKATEATYTDPKFTSHRSGAKGTNLAVGYYHYLRFSMSGVAQANHFVKTVGALDPDDLPPMLDVEDSTGADANTPGENIKIVQEWLDTVEAALGKRPFIYSGGGFWGRPSFGNPAQFANYDFCWSKYSASNSCPQVPDNLVPRIKMWQYRADAFPQYNIPAGQTDGINGAVDQDVFYGDLAAFQGFVGGAAPEYAAKYSKQSHPLASVGAVEVKVGESVSGTIEMTNTGTATWSPGKVFLAPIPRDAASPYRAPSWVSATRASTVDKDVKPGEIGRFALDIGGSAPGDGSLKLGWVAEGVTWFADAPKGGGPKDGVAEVKVHVVPGAGGAGGAGGAPSSGGAGASAAGKAGGGAAGKAGTSGVGGATAPGGAGGAGVAGAASPGGAGSAGLSGAPSGNTVLPAADDGGGCGCRVTPREPARAAGLAAGLVGLLAARRRRARMSPPPVLIERARGRDEVLVVCDHASRAIPAEYGSLGLPAEALAQHIAYDLGALWAARRLAERLDATLVASGHSRLVIDCNRPPGVSSSIPALTGGITVPGNANLDERARRLRRELSFEPYHAAVRAALDARRDARGGRGPVLLSIHSFTPELEGRRRPWNVALLYGRDARLAHAVRDVLARDRSLVVGDNEPYRVSDETDYTVPVHGEARGLLHTAFELRQDGLATPEAARAWGDRLFGALAAIELDAL